MNNIKYELIIFWSESDESFIVEVPELAGCKADGETYEEAIANAKMVINDWIETAKKMGRVVPNPKGKLMYA
jgi:predicted RNase H-like HicB family nuclease